MKTLYNLIGKHLLLIGLLAVTLDNLHLSAEDWPTYRHDNRRSAVTSETPKLPLRQKWVYSAPTRPQTAWPGPAKWDSYANIRDLKSMRNFDPVFYVTVVGTDLYFGSSVDDAVHCLDALSGREKWVFFTDGPVRLPPSWYRNKIYFGSDDGSVYCLRATDGRLVWRYTAGTNARCIPSNGKLIPYWPCRTGVLLQDGKAYFAMSLLPWRESYLCAVDALTGKDKGAGLYKQAYPHLTSEGAMLASTTQLYISQGRQRPIVCDIANGRIKGAFGKSGEGGVYALLTDDGTLIQGRGQNHGSHGELRTFDARTKDYIVKFPSATCMIATHQKAYLISKDELAAFDRQRYLDLNVRRNKLSSRIDVIKNQLKDKSKTLSQAQKEKLAAEIKLLQNQINALVAEMPKCFLWKSPCPYPHGLILAGDILLAGGTDKLAAFDSKTGCQLWTGTVDGKAHGLAVANGRLFVSTDSGKIYCFAP